jgi:hypothetical protein
VNQNFNADNETIVEGMNHNALNLVDEMPDEDPTAGDEEEMELESKEELYDDFYENADDPVAVTSLGIQNVLQAEHEHDGSLVPTVPLLYGPAIEPAEEMIQQHAFVLPG